MICPSIGFHHAPRDNKYLLALLVLRPSLFSLCGCLSILVFFLPLTLCLLFFLCHVDCLSFFCLHVLQHFLCQSFYIFSIKCFIVSLGNRTVTVQGFEYQSQAQLTQKAQAIAEQQARLKVMRENQDIHERLLEQERQKLEQQARAMAHEQPQHYWVGSPEYFLLTSPWFSDVCSCVCFPS